MLVRPTSPIAGQTVKYAAVRLTDTIIKRIVNDCRLIDMVKNGGYTKILNEPLNMFYKPPPRCSVMIKINHQIYYNSIILVTNQTGMKHIRLPAVFTHYIIPKNKSLLRLGMFIPLN